MYHSHRYAKVGWPGEPEVDATKEYEDREVLEGWELHPQECLKLAYEATLRERVVIAGAPSRESQLSTYSYTSSAVKGSSTACLINLNASSGLLRAAKYAPPIHPFFYQ